MTAIPSSVVLILTVEKQIEKTCHVNIVVTIVTSKNLTSNHSISDYCR